MELRGRGMHDATHRGRSACPGATTASNAAASVKLTACGAFLAGGLIVASGALVAASVPAAEAEAVETSYVSQQGGIGASARQTEIEQLTDAYDEACSAALWASTKAAANQIRIDNLEAKLPAQQERSDAAARQLYKLQSNNYGIAELLLSSESLDDFIRQTEYMERVNRANLSAIGKLRNMNERLETARENLAAAKAESDELLQTATEALDAAKAARVAKAASGIAAAQGQATSMGGSASVGKDGVGKDQPEDFRVAASTDADALADGADWLMSEEEFIATWAPRIDAYLAGSALAGQGENFARSSWRYCVDPRWSPAISNTESGKGAVCIRPHNAWGWGAADSDPYGLASQWDSWEEAIDAHVRGLANGYGYTITISGAKMYCPNTWQSWYNKTLGEMARI